MLLSVFLAVTLSCEAFLHFCAVIHQVLLAALFFPHVLEFALHVSLSFFYIVPFLEELPCFFPQRFIKLYFQLLILFLRVLEMPLYLFINSFCFMPGDIA